MKLAQLKFDNATKTKEAAERAFGTASAEATQAEEALNTAKAELAKAQEELKAIPGVDDIDTGAIEKLGWMLLPKKLLCTSKRSTQPKLTPLWG